MEYPDGGDLCGGIGDHDPDPLPEIINCTDCTNPLHSSDAWYCQYCNTVGLCPACGGRHDVDCLPSNQVQNKEEDMADKKTFKKLKLVKKAGTKAGKGKNLVPKKPAKKTTPEERAAKISEGAQRRSMENPTVRVGQVATCMVIRIPRWAAEKIGLVVGDVVRIGTVGKQLQIAHTAKEAERAKLRAQHKKELEAKKVKRGKKAPIKNKIKPPKAPKKVVKKTVKKAAKKAKVSKPKPAVTETLTDTAAV